MLSGRFRTLTMHLLLALAGLVVRGRMPCAAVAAIEAAVRQRSARLQALMDRYAAGTLRTCRRFAARTPRPRVAVDLAAEPAPGRRKLWPEHIAGWLNLVGLNHPSMDVRYRWLLTGHNQSHLGQFVLAFRAFLETDGEMRGMLAISRDARRASRWLLRMGDTRTVPDILREPARSRREGAGAPRAGRSRWTPPRPRREPDPFETPPGDLTREERVRRGMWVPEPRVDPVPGPPAMRTHRPHTIFG